MEEDQKQWGAFGLLARVCNVCRSPLSSHAGAEDAHQVHQIPLELLVVHPMIRSRYHGSCTKDFRLISGPLLGFIPHARSE